MVANIYSFYDNSIFNNFSFPHYDTKVCTLLRIS